MRASHFIIGLVFLIAFLLTGQWMRFHFNDSFPGTESQRMLYRASHVYLLFTALLNLLVASHWRSETSKWRRIVRTAGSILLLGAPVLSLTAFLIEPAQADLEQRSLTSTFVISSFAGVVLHLITSRFRAL